MLLPKNVDFQPGGPSPLARSDEFVITVCPICGGPAKEKPIPWIPSCVLPGIFSAIVHLWTDQEPFERKDVDYWMPVNQYIGGVEHAILHLLYSRFL